MKKNIVLEDVCSFKIAKHGIEMYMLCEAKTDYAYDFIGKRIQIPITLPRVDEEKQSHSTKVV